MYHGLAVVEERLVIDHVGIGLRVRVDLLGPSGRYQEAIWERRRPGRILLGRVELKPYIAVSNEDARI